MCQGGVGVAVNDALLLLSGEVLVRLATPFT